MNNQINIFDVCNTKDRYVREITYEEAKPFILNIHYAHRIPPISKAVGLFLRGGCLIGVCTFGVPVSRTLCLGIAGKENFKNVLELNRLVILPEHNGHNNASFLIGHSLKLLPNNTFVVSYADTGMTHIGYVYQASNFLYTGKTKARTDVCGGENKHHRHSIKGETRRVNRTAKHRYVYLVGDRRTKKKMLKQLKYPVCDYPKGDEVRYEINFFKQ